VNTPTGELAAPRGAWEKDQPCVLQAVPFFIAEKSELQWTLGNQSRRVLDGRTRSWKQIR